MVYIQVVTIPYKLSVKPDFLGKKNKKKITHLSSANVAFSVAMNLLAASQQI